MNLASQAFACTLLDQALFRLPFNPKGPLDCSGILATCEAFIEGSNLMLQAAASTHTAREGLAAGRSSLATAQLSIRAGQASPAHMIPFHSVLPCFPLPSP